MAATLSGKGYPGAVAGPHGGSGIGDAGHEAVPEDLEESPGGAVGGYLIEGPECGTITFYRTMYAGL